MMEAGSKIYVAGHQGLVGSAILRHLEQEGFTNLLTRTRAELDLCEQAQVRAFFAREKPDYVFLAAARVGGILANSRSPADFIRDNLLIEAQVIDAAYQAGVRKLLLLGSSCIYPARAPQPLRETYLLTGPLEPTNEAYAVAKIAGIKMLEAYCKQYGWRGIAVMPTNLYGPGDNFDLETSHVIPALMHKLHAAKHAQAPAVTVWGSGTPRREFLHVDDLAAACLFLMRHDDEGDMMNIGVGKDITIAELAKLMAEVVGFRGQIIYDRSKPDGTPQKLLDVSRLEALGWRAKIGLREGLSNTYRWYVDHAVR